MEAALDDMCHVDSSQCLTRSKEYVLLNLNIYDNNQYINVFGFFCYEVVIDYCCLGIVCSMGI
jgi:hypothetical protein